MSKRIGFFVNTDYCNGCQTCQVACREINRVPFDETWLSVVRGKPKRVGGALRMHFSPVPELDRCAQCLAQEEEPYCQAVCPSRCLRVGLYDDLEPLVSGSEDGWIALSAWVSEDSEDAGRFGRSECSKGKEEEGWE